MAWETRRRGTQYYTRTRRVGRRRVREYVGTGLKGVLAAEEDRLRRAQEAEARKQWQEEKRRIEDADELLESLFTGCTTWMRRELEAAGYHQHAGGEWRKKRGD